MSVAYQTTGYPFPMPTLTVRFGRLAEAPDTNAYAGVVDTGADMTIAPADILVDLEAQALQETNLISQWGDVHPVTLYLVDVEVEGQLFPGVMVAGDPTTDEIILGRNLLNQMPLFLDGPLQQTRLVADSDLRRLRAQS